jgi:Enoyl-(Acyl carrier protein) reductase
VVLVGRDPDRLQRAAHEVDARSTAAFDAEEAAAVRRFFESSRGRSTMCSSRPADRTTCPCSRRMPTTCTARSAITSSRRSRSRAAPRGKVRPGGSLVLMGGTGGRKISRELALFSAATAVLPPFTAALALALAPIRVNLIAAASSTRRCRPSLLGDELEAGREELRTTLPIGRVVGPADVAALAVHLMANTALTVATYDIDGGQQFVS